MTPNRRFNVGRAYNPGWEFFDFFMILLEARPSTAKLRKMAYANELNIPKELERELGAHFLRHVYGDRDPLALVIRGHLYLERFLEEVIRKKFKHADLLVNGSSTFVQKARILRAKNYLDEKVYSDILHLNSLRNQFAHNLRFDLADFDMSKFSYCGDLYSRIDVTERERHRLVNLYMLRQVLEYLVERLGKRHRFLHDVIQGEIG